MTLKPRCECSTCDACPNPPDRSGTCVNCFDGQPEFGDPAGSHEPLSDRDLDEIRDEDEYAAASLPASALEMYEVLREGVRIARDVAGRVNPDDALLDALKDWCDTTEIDVLGQTAGSRITVDSGSEGSHAQHTPGPLTAYVNDTEGSHVINEATGYIVCEQHDNEADAILHAAAPAMLEALRAAHKHAHKALTAKSNSYTDEANMLDVIAAALAAAERE